MARTYRKVIKLGVCSGSNTEYYRYKRRKTRRKNNQNLRNLIANFPIDEIDDRFVSTKMIHDDWDEPTDGTYIIFKTDKNDFINDDGITARYSIKRYGSTVNHWNRKYGSKLKSKHLVHEIQSKRYRRVI